MPAKKLRQPKQVRDKLPGAAVGKLRQTHSEPTGTADGKILVSLIPVVKKRGRPSLAAKFAPTVDIKDALQQLGKGFFVGEEKELFKTPLKVRPLENQKRRQSAALPSSSPSRSKKTAAGGSRSSSRGSPGSTASSPDSPYFLRSKGAADETVNDSLRQRRRSSKSGGGDSVEKKSPARRTKSVGLSSVEKGSPARSGRKAVQSPAQKKAKVDKPVAVIKAARASLSGRKDHNQENSIHDSERVKSVKKDAAETASSGRTPTKSRRQTRTSQDLTSEELANEAEGAVRIETGKKRKREQDETEDPKTKRAKVVIVQSSETQEMVQEPNQKTTMRLMVHRANIEDIGDRVVLDVDGEQASYRRVEEMRSVEKVKTRASPWKEVSQTTRGQSRTTKVTSVVTDHRVGSSWGHSSTFESVDSSALGGSAQRLNQASRDLDEAVRRQMHDLTANISVRSSWSAHLYEKGSGSASKLPRALVAGTSRRNSIDLLRPLGAVTPSVDFQMNWDTSAVKEQLVSSVLPQKQWTDELVTVPKTVAAKGANSQPHGKGLLEKSQFDDLVTVPIMLTAKEGNIQPSAKGLLEESAIGFATSIRTPLRRPDIDATLFDRGDVVKFGEDMFSHKSKKTVCVEEETKTWRRPSSGRHSAVPFDTPVQPLRGNGASLRRSVDRMLPAVDRVNVVRGRSVEPSMIRSESIHKQPKFNGRLTAKEPKPVFEIKGGRCGRVCRHLLCLVGTPLLVFGAVCVVHLALAAGYLGEIF